VLSWRFVFENLGPTVVDHCACSCFGGVVWCVGEYTQVRFGLTAWNGIVLGGIVLR
jgi:hypothetical protein